MSVLCAGELVADIVVRPVNDIDFGTDSQIVEQIDITNGGDALNTSVGLARLGCHVIFAGKAGNDSFGQRLIEIAREAGVDVSCLRTSDTMCSDKVIALIRRDGERCFLHCLGSNREFSAADIPDEALEKCSHFHIGGTFHLPQFDGEGAASVLRRAREMGLTTSMDVAFDHSGRWMDVIRVCMPHLSYFVPSMNEAMRMVGSQDCSVIASRFKALGVENVMVKLGGEGVYVSPREGRAFRMGVYPADVVDATGAGDGFMAGLIMGLQDGVPLEECVMRATANAAFVIGQVGATTGVPSRETLLGFIAQTPKPEVSYCE